MNRPLALIEGDLALPNALPFYNLPPPFGSQRRPAQRAAQREPQPAAPTTAQRAIQDAVQSTRPSSNHSRLPPGVKFLFFYKLPQQRDQSHRFYEQLAEARCYQEMDRPRPRSSRSDHVFGAAIFVGCSIALAWLLATCTAHDADKTKTAAATRPTMPIHVSTSAGQEPVRPPQQVVAGVTPTVARNAPLAIHSSPEAALSSTPAQLPQHAEPHVTTRASTHEMAKSPIAQPNRRAAIARLTQTHIDERVASSRALRPTTRPSLSTQPEWPARPASANDTAERTALLDWAAQQRRANVTTRASVPMPASGDTDWNAHMTQRRITDNPDAFQAGRAQK